MDILSKNDDEIYELAKPIWDNLVRSSNLKDYGGFTKEFVLSVDYPVFFVLQFAAAKNVHLPVFVPCTEVRN